MGFFLKNRTFSDLSANPLSTIKQHPFTQRDNVRVITSLVKSVFFIRHGWRKWTEGCTKLLFQRRSIRDRNSSIGAKDLWEWGSERINVFRWHSRFRDGRELLEDAERGSRPKSIRTEVNIAAVAYLVKNGRRNASRISRILENPQDCSSSEYEKGFGKEKVVCTFCSTLLETWAKGRSSHILPRHYRDGRCRKKVIKNCYGGRDLVFWCFACDPETKRQISGWVGETLPRPKKLKFQRSRMKTMLIIFSTIKA